MERAQEYKFPLCLVFVDYEKAFDSVEVNAVLNAIGRQGVQRKYVKLLEDVNNGCSTYIKLFHDNLEIPVKRGVRQGDTISPKLFTAALEDVFRRLDWEDRGVRVDGEHLSHLRFADDIVLISHTVEEVEQSLNELNELSEQIGLRINRKKTQLLRNTVSKSKAPNRTMQLDGEVIAEVDSYTYLGQQITYDHSLDEEISRRRRAGWFAFRNIIDIMKKLPDRRVKTLLFNSMVLPAMLYGSETWNLRKSDKEKLGVTQRAMERRLLGVRRREEVHREDLRKQTEFADIVQTALKSKLRWAGHVARREDNRWTEKVTFWWPRDLKRPLGRPKTRWRDELKTIEAKTGTAWHQWARNREMYKERINTALFEAQQPPPPRRNPMRRARNPDREG